MRSRRRSRSQPPPAGSVAQWGGEPSHDPLAGIGGAAPARSALTLRAVLAVFGLTFCSASAIAMHLAEVDTWLVALFTVLAVVAVVDLVVILRRKRRGEPG